MAATNEATDGNPTTVDESNAATTTTTTREATETKQEMAHMDAMMQASSVQSENRGSCCDSCTRSVNLAIENTFYRLGACIGKCPYIVLIIVLIILTLCCFGLSNLEMEQDITNLWTPTDSPIWEEREFIAEYWGNEGGGQIVFVAESRSGDNDGNILSKQHLREWYAFNVRMKTDIPTIDYQYSDDDGTQQTIKFGIFYEDFYPIIDLDTLGEMGADHETVQNYASKVIPFCKPGGFSPLEAQFQLPCAMLSIFDCFSEGGTFFPYSNYLAKTFFSTIAPANPYTYLRSSFEALDEESLSEIVGRSCPIFTGKIMSYNLIYGGDVRSEAGNESSPVLSLKTWESVVLMDSPYGIAKKIKIATKQCNYTETFSFECPEISEDDLDEAHELYNEWQLKVINWGLSEIDDLDKNPLLKISMWLDRSGPDLLREASSADFILLFIAYFSMIVFASLTAFRPSNLFLSKSEASCFGVILVLMAVVGTMGLGSSIGTLSPEAVQVLPFIALGFGVDDMFVLIFAYKFRNNLSAQEMVAETVRVAGSSVALTSIANCLAFIIATQMVLPSVANFAVFGALVVTLNFVAVIFGFTAILALVARRQLGGYRDCAFCCCFTECTKYEGAANNASSSSSPNDINSSTAENPESPSASSTNIAVMNGAANHTMDDGTSMFEPLFNILIKTPVRVFCICICLILFIIGIIGVGEIEVGLPLEEIVPSDSYAADFLKVRTSYYFTHTFSLYTDANGAKLDNIDWANKFEEFIHLTDDLHSISPLVYDGFATHTFWARSLRDYLIESKAKAALSSTASYKLGEAVDVQALLAGPTVIRSNLCESDRKKFCPAMAVKYFWNKEPSIPSPLVACLLGNKDYLESDCFDYVSGFLPDSFFADYAWAHQLYIESYDSDKTDITGLYVKSSKDTVNVYYKYPCNDIECDGYIFQSNENECEKVGDNGDCVWYLVDSDFNLMYIGEGTPTSLDATDLASLDSIPSQTGWKDPMTDRPAYITQNYMDFPVFAAGSQRDLTNFLMNDVDIITTFHYSGKGKYEWLLMRKLMSTGVTAYKSVSLGPYNSPIECDAVLEASEICGAIRDELSFGYINCGGIEESALDTNWWIGNCSDDYVLVATSIDSGTVTDITSEEACKCLGGNKNLNHIKSIDIEDDLDCFNPTETISITCTQFTSCDSLSSCYEEIEKFAVVDGKKQCNVTRLQQFETDYKTDGITTAAADNLAECLFSYYDELSDCCQESIESVLLTDDVDFTCSDINGYVSNSDASDDAKKAVCNARDKCSWNSATKICENLCYDSVFADCTDIIYQTHNYGFHLNVLGNPLVTDFATIQALAAADPTSCCSAALSTVTVGEQSCIIPKATYFNFTTFKYDYDVCSDEVIANVSCGTTYNNSDSFSLTTFATYFTTFHGQAACLYTNIDDLPDGCCKNVINDIGFNSFRLTKECEGDAQILCGSKGGESSFAIGMFNESSKCAKSIIAGAGTQTLSPKCLASFAFCQSVDDWPATFGNKNATIPCDDGYIGQQTRRCVMPTGSFADWSSDIDTSNCTIRSCPAETGSFGQSWPETVVGNVATAQGGYVGTDNINQVGQTLQGQLASQGETCSYFQPPLYTIPFARRKCEISSIDGTAVWKTPLVECRPGIFKAWTNIKTKTVCDMLSETAGLGTGANIIKVVPWSYVLGEDVLTQLIIDGIAEKELIAYSQQYCEQVLSNCAAFSYDSSKYMSYFFDYCGNLLTAEFLNGTIPGTGGAMSWSDHGLNTFADTMTTYIAPLSLSQFTAEYCSAQSAADPSTTFIPASEAWNDEGIPDPFCFDNTLFLYYIDPLGGVLSQDAIEFSVPYSDINISNTHIVCSKNSFTIGNMKTDQDAVDIILSLRERLNKWKDDGFPVIPGGFVVSFYSQYIGVQGYLVTNLIFVSIAVIGVGFIFLINPIAVFVCICCNIMMIVEVYGFSHYVGLKINGVLVLNIVIAIGLTMEFTAHIGRAYVLTSHSYGNMTLSEGQNRMKKTLQEMFIPVTLGAITTIIGIAPISAANFPYFKLYYFNLYVIIVVFGWLNGVIFQPIFLSFYPPKSFEMEKVATSSISNIGANNANNTKHTKQVSVELGNVAI